MKLIQLFIFLILTFCLYCAALENSDENNNPFPYSENEEQVLNRKKRNPQANSGLSNPNGSDDNRLIRGLQKISQFAGHPAVHHIIRSIFGKSSSVNTRKPNQTPSQERVDDKKNKITLNTPKQSMPPTDKYAIDKDRQKPKSGEHKDAKTEKDKSIGESQETKTSIDPNNHALPSDDKEEKKLHTTKPESVRPKSAEQTNIITTKPDHEKPKPLNLGLKEEVLQHFNLQRRDTATKPDHEKPKPLDMHPQEQALSHFDLQNKTQLRRTASEPIFSKLGNHSDVSSTESIRSTVSNISHISREMQGFERTRGANPRRTRRRRRRPRRRSNNPRPRRRSNDHNRPVHVEVVLGNGDSRKNVKIIA